MKSCKSGQKRSDFTSRRQLRGTTTCKCKRESWNVTKIWWIGANSPNWSSRCGRRTFAKKILIKNKISRTRSDWQHLTPCMLPGTSIIGATWKHMLEIWTPRFTRTKRTSTVPFTWSKSKIITMQWTKLTKLEKLSTQRSPHSSLSPTIVLTRQFRNYNFWKNSKRWSSTKRPPLSKRKQICTAVGARDKSRCLPLTSKFTKNCSTFGVSWSTNKTKLTVLSTLPRWLRIRATLAWAPKFYSNSKRSCISRRTNFCAKKETWAVKVESITRSRKSKRSWSTIWPRLRLPSRMPSTIRVQLMANLSTKPNSCCLTCWNSQMILSRTCWAYATKSLAFGNLSIKSPPNIELTGSNLATKTMRTLSVIANKLWKLIPKMLKHGTYFRRRVMRREFMLPNNSHRPSSTQMCTRFFTRAEPRDRKRSRNIFCIVTLATTFCPVFSTNEEVLSKIWSQNLLTPESKR